jgi:hypothetical protein
MALPGQVQSAPTGARGFDCDFVLQGATLTALAKNFDFCVRYVSLKAGGPFPADADITEEEATAILQAGLAIMPVQHVFNPGFFPNGPRGAVIGTRAADNAKAAGFPNNVNLWLDLEGINAAAAAQDVIAYANAWFDAVHASGFVPGVYVGANAILDGAQLFNALKFQHYWKSGSTVPQIPVRGYQMIQTIPGHATTVDGIALDLDLDLTHTDALGGHVQWLKVP